MTPVLVLIAFVVVVLVLAAAGVFGMRELRRSQQEMFVTVRTIAEQALDRGPFPEPPTDPAHEPTPTPDADDDMWDPTDSAPWLSDARYADKVPTPQWANDPGPNVTHPLGIPGLEVPYGRTIQQSGEPT